MDFQNSIYDLLILSNINRKKISLQEVYEELFIIGVTLDEVKCHLKNLVESGCILETTSDYDIFYTINEQGLEAQKELKESWIVFQKKVSYLLN